jgi:hypothetical protein
MATVANNDLTRGLRGRIGKWLVFRMVRGKTIASRAPRKPDPRKQSAAQRLTRSTFREASAWAVRILLDPAKKQYYADLAKDQHLPNAYTAAVREYMRGAAAKRMEAEHHYSIPTNMETNIDGQCAPIQSSLPKETASEMMSHDVVRSPKVTLLNDCACQEIKYPVYILNLQSQSTLSTLNRHRSQRITPRCMRAALVNS